MSPAKEGSVAPERSAAGPVPNGDSFIDAFRIEDGIEPMSSSIRDGRPSRVSTVGPELNSVHRAESFFAALECELIVQESFSDRSEVRLIVFDYLEGFYNPHRRHSAIDYHSPMSYERIHVNAPPRASTTHRSVKAVICSQYRVHSRGVGRNGWSVCMSSISNIYSIS